MTMRLASLIFVLGVFAASASPADAQAPTGKTMLEIVTALEALGYGPITEVSQKRGRWEVEAYKGDTPYELHVDGTTGRTVAQRPDDGDSKPPANAKKLSEILQALAAQGYTQIVEASFETRTWEIELHRGGAKRELRVDPVSGQVLSDRPDH